jgi:hypothetical protein
VNQGAKAFVGRNNDQMGSHTLKVYHGVSMWTSKLGDKNIST